MAEQTLNDIEIIVIDDGSADGSSSVCDSFADDHRFSIFHKKNGGLSSARNVGMKIARADFIMFVDSDDWVEPEFCEVPYKLAMEYNADIIFFQYRGCRKDSSLFYYNFKETPGILSKERAMSFIDNGGSVVVWNKLFRRDIVKDMSFLEGHLYEDNLFTPEAIHRSEVIVYTEKILYNHIVRNDSIMTIRDKQADDDFFRIHTLASVRMTEWGYSESAGKYIIKLYWKYRKMFGRNSLHINECTKYLKDHNKELDFLSFKGKLMYMIMNISPWLFDTICLLKVRNRN